jgi:NTE family protein
VGSSAGALIGSLWAAGMSPEAIRELLFGLQRKDFWDPGFGRGLLKGHKFRAMLKSHLPVRQMEDCRYPLSLSVYDKREKSTFVVTQGCLATAIYASCAVPILFQPVVLKGRLGADGGVLDRHGMLGAQEGERIFYHHLKSRSPWRKKDSLALQVPQRANMQALVIDGLPRLGPFKLNLGPSAFDKGLKGAREGLGQELQNLTNEVFV